MILVVLFVIFAGLAILTKVANDNYWGCVTVLAVTGCAAAFAVLISFGLVAAVAHVPLHVENERLAYEQRYQTITDVIGRDEKNSVVIAGEIADYNAEVMQGRNKMHDPWIGVMQYQFWDELPLIEYSNSSEIEN